MVRFNTTSNSNKQSSTASYCKYLGLGTSVDVSDICKELGIDKSELTSEDFIIEPQYATHTATGSGTVLAGGYNNVDVETGGGSSYTLTKSYNPATGIFTCSSKTSNSSYASGTRKGGGASCSSNANSQCKIYLYKEIE